MNYNKILILSFLLVSMISTINAQNITTEIWTPNGHVVSDTYYRGELLDSTQKDILEDSIDLYYPNATQVGEATTHYNCHSYAWYRSEGGTKNVWIGLYTQTAEDVYWTDDSYFEVCSLNDATKISYVGNHSAIKISSTLCRSKWGPWGLIEHAVDYGPSIYQMTSNRTYYLKTPSIQGTNILCSNYTYSVSIPASCSVTWTSSSNISINSSTGYASRIGSANGEGWIEADISSGCGSVTVRKEIWVGLPIYTELDLSTSNSGGDHEIMACDYTSADAEYDGGSGHAIDIDEYEWDMPYASDWDIYEEYSGGGIEMRYVEIDYWEDPPPSTEVIKLRAHNDCGWSSWKSITVDVDDNCGWYLMFTPNPANEETTLSIETASSNEPTNKSTSPEAVIDESIEWDIEVYDHFKKPQLKKNNIKGKSTNIQTVNWKNGIYVVRVKYMDRIISGKLVVEK